MNEKQIDKLLSSLEDLAYGVNKIGDAAKSVAFYIWLPVYILLFGCGIAVSVWLYFFR